MARAAWLKSPASSRTTASGPNPAFPLRLLEGRSPPYCDVHGCDPQRPLNVDSGRPRRNDGPKVLWPVDLREAREKSAARDIAHDLRDLAFQLHRCQSADKLVERLSADEREEVRLGIEAVMQIRVALDRLGQRNAQLHKERQRTP
jgi:hypothetical protein